MRSEGRRFDHDRRRKARRLFLERAQQPQNGVVALDDDDLDQASGGISCPDQIVFFCTRCHEAKTVTKTSSALICPDCGTPFGASTSPNPDPT